MIPRFTNPHNLHVTVKHTTREALNENIRVSSANADTQNGMLVQLEQILKRTLGDAYSEGEAARNDVTASPERKIKRRRTSLGGDEGLQQTGSEAPVVTIPFRLLSQTLPPKPVILEARPPPVISVTEPSCEDDADEAARRKQQAESVAVDCDWLVQEAKKPTIPRPADERKVTHFRASLPSPSPLLFVAERLRAAVKPPQLARTLPATDVQPSPHTLPPGIGYPVLEVTDLSSESPSVGARASRKRRRRSHQDKLRPPPCFWRPLREWGIKAAGCTMGYEGSWPVFADDPKRYKYQRDTMRKGTLLF